jgi:tRNA1(Val) A37 N6-methylase TrmN6
MAGVGRKKMNELIRDLSSLRAILGRRLALILSTWEQNAAGGQQPPDELAAQLDDQERLVYHLLVAPRPVAIADVETALGADCVATLLQLDVLRRTGGQAESAGLRLRFAAGSCLLTGNGGPNRYVHIGYDTTRLIDAAGTLRSAATALELCCGSAGAAIRLARTHDRVIATDLFEGVARVARANVALAGIDQIEVRTGDLWAPVKGERFDTILANPPFVPTLHGCEVDPVAAAGADGLDFARAIWGAADSFLAPEGILLLLLGFLGRSEVLLAEPELLQLARDKRWRIEIVAIEPAREIERLVVPLLQEEPTTSRVGSLREQARRLGATHYHIVFLRIAADPDPAVIKVQAHPQAGANLRIRMDELRRQRRAHTI